MISIASAPGWKARFLDEEAFDGFKVVTLVSWALTEVEGGGTEIVGVIQRAATPSSPHGALVVADEVEGFQGYVFTGLVTREADT
jgi:hypothetical protein